MLNDELTPAQAAKLQGVSVPTIHAWIKNGRIQNVKQYGPRKIRIPVDSITPAADRIVAIREAHETIDYVFDKAISRGDVDETRKLRIALKILVKYWNDPKIDDLDELLRVLASATVKKPGVYYQALAKVIADLGAFQCN